jgi:hypothetical protein
MLLGSNTNVRHRGVVFHVQTEDSGVKRPHVITHLYHGGTILASDKQSYAPWVDAPELEGRVKSLMEEQHQSMLARVRSGELDAVIQERLGGAAASDASDSRSTTHRDTLTPPSSPVVEPTQPGPDRERTLAAPPPRAFGEGIVSDKPLDEVILGYLVEKARKRKRAQQ